MKLALAAPLAFVIAAAVPQAPAQAQYYQGPSITIPMPGTGQERRDERWDARDRRERCAGLESRAHELRERIERVGYSEERQRLEFRLRETRDQLREHCRY